jgi:phosphopantothenoylcysteine decarboxylase / phosphopantothenate---cysteine ligase
MLQRKKILIGITASIAAYKIINLVRLLVKQGAEVKVIMTPAAVDFVTPLTLSTLSNNKVLLNIADQDAWNDHVHLGRWADIMLIAPLSCNTLAKMATGLCDNLLMAVYLSATCKVIVAPAMDEDMWKHNTTKKNLKILEANGNEIIPVTHGSLASGLVGDGRMAEPETIIQTIINNITLSNDFKNKNVLITAGPTYEPIDPVRFIGNRSSGKMGIAIAKYAMQRGANVTLVLGPVQIDNDLSGINVINVKTANEMFEAAIGAFETADIAIMAAAVADYTPNVVANEKIKKKEEDLTIELIKTKDILKEIGINKKENQIVVGFALETNNEEANALDKLKRKNANMIVLNSTKNIGTTFGGDENKVTIFENNGKKHNFETKHKNEVANDILDVIMQHINSL